MKIENNIPVTLTDKPERTLDMVAAEIRAFTAGMLNNAIEIGRRMVEAKAMLPYGQFGAWISENTGYSASAANNFMRLFDEYGAMQGSLFGASAECQTFGKLPPSKALALLAVPADEREAFAVENDAEHTSVRELKRLIAERERERDEARRASEEAREELSAAVNKEAAVSRELDEAREAIRTAEEQNKSLRKEIQRLESAEPDGLLLASIREEERANAVAELQEKIDAAEAKAKAAETKRLTLQKRLKDTEAIAQKDRADAAANLKEAVAKAWEDAKAENAAALEEANAAAQRLQVELDALRKETEQANAAPPPTNGKEIGAFETLFNAAKDAANRMREIRLSADAETARKLSKVMLTLAEEIRRCAE